MPPNDVLRRAHFSGSSFYSLIRNRINIRFFKKINLQFAKKNHFFKKKKKHSQIFFSSIMGHAQFYAPQFVFIFQRVEILWFKKKSIIILKLNLCRTEEKAGRNMFLDSSTFFFIRKYRCEWPFSNIIALLFSRFSPKKSLKLCGRKIKIIK